MTAVRDFGDMCQILMTVVRDFADNCADKIITDLGNCNVRIWGGS